VKSVFVISFSDLAADPRVNRQIRLLGRKYRVIAVGLGDPQIKGVEYIPLKLPARSFAYRAWRMMMLKLGMYESCYWSDPRIRQAVAAVKDVHADAIIANDLATLPLALALAKGRPVALDAHEYSPREYEDSWLWRFFIQRYNEYLCRKYLPACAGMLTVCEGIAKEYHAHFGVNPAVMFNAPAYADLSPRKTRPDIVRMIHHGGAQPGRKIEQMIGMMDHLDDRFHLDLILLPSIPRYLDRLKSLVAGRPRLRVLPPLPSEALPAQLNEYDIGVHLLPPNSFNNRHALPNKFFDFIQARLAVAIGPSLEMARLARQYGCGVIAEDFTPEALAASLNGLTSDDIDRLKQASHAAARDVCFEKSGPVLLDLLDKLLGACDPARHDGRRADFF
jgi:hypothetical protein